jgi:hypothetical protein
MIMSLSEFWIPHAPRPVLYHVPVHWHQRETEGMAGSGVHTVTRALGRHKDRGGRDEGADKKEAKHLEVSF